MLKSSPHILILITIFAILRPAFSEEHALKSPSQNLELFLGLPFTREDEISAKVTIENVISTELDQLLENQNIVRDAREQLEALPTLRLIAFMVSDPDISQLIKRIGIKDVRVYFVLSWLNLLLKDLNESELFVSQLSGFSEFLKLDSAIIQTYVVQDDYLELLNQIFFQDLL